MNGFLVTEARLCFLLHFAIVFAFGCTPTTDRVIPEKTGDFYRIKIQDQVMEINPQIGGRITSLRLGELEFLTGPEIHPDYWGSTFWPSPQKAWGGTLSAELDRLPYTVIEGNEGLKLESSIDPQSGCAFIKEFYGNAEKGSFTIKYSIVNRSEQIQEVAPWEVTRVRTHGLTFFPKGEGERWGGMASLAKDLSGITWFAYEAEKIPLKNTKFFSDGSEGWIAQINEGVMLVKKFPDIALESVAPSEAEVEVYANAEKTYIEIEQQGAYETLQPGDTVTWEVSWFLRALPDTLIAEVGNEALVEFARNLIR